MWGAGRWIRSSLPIIGEHTVVTTWRSETVVKKKKKEKQAVIGKEKKTIVCKLLLLIPVDTWSVSRGIGETVTGLAPSPTRDGMRRMATALAGYRGDTGVEGKMLLTFYSLFLGVAAVDEGCGMV